MRKRVLWITLSGAVLVGAVAFSTACGGGGDDGEEENAEETTEATANATDDSGSNHDNGGGSTAGDLSLLRDIALDPSDVGDDIEIEADDETFTAASSGSFNTSWFQGTFEGTGYSSYSLGPSGMTAGFSRDYTGSSGLSLEDARLHLGSFQDEGGAASFFNEFSGSIVDSTCADQAGDAGTVTEATDSDICDYRPNEREERMLGIVRVGRFVAIYTSLGDPGASQLSLAQDVLGEAASRMEDAG